VLVAGPLVGVGLIILTDVPFWLVNVIAGVVYSVTMPFVALTTACWAMPEREYQYAGCDYAIRHALGCGPGFLGHARTLLITKSWWDTVDALAANVVGPLVRAHPGLVTVMDDWIDDDNDWLVRTAIIHQLHAHDGTDTARLFGATAGWPWPPCFSSARPSGGRCGSTRRPTPTPSWRSWRRTTSSRRCRRGVEVAATQGAGVTRPRVEIGIDCLIRRPGAVLGGRPRLRTGRRRRPPVPQPGAVDGDGPVVFLQRVGGEGTEEPGPPRPLHPPPELLVERLLGLGATLIGDPTGSGDHWSFLVLADPEGNELCICREVDDDVG
jgi:hypothetical protein